MSDRCSLRVIFRKADKEIVESTLGVDVDHHQVSEEGLWAEIQLDEANYGLSDERNELARLNVPFFGESGEGCEYPAYEFAAIDGKMEEALSCIEVGLVVEFDKEKGEAVPRGVADAQAYLRALKRVKKLLKYKG